LRAYTAVCKRERSIVNRFVKDFIAIYTDAEFWSVFRQYGDDTLGSVSGAGGIPPARLATLDIRHGKIPSAEGLQPHKWLDFFAG
jgi:hypothetical protein